MPGYRLMATDAWLPTHGYRRLATDSWLPTPGYQNTILIYQCFELAWLPNNLILDGWLPICDEGEAGDTDKAGDRALFAICLFTG